MRTETEIRSAIRELEGAVKLDQRLGGRGSTPGGRVLGLWLDVLKWVGGDDDTQFEKTVGAPTRAMDRAERQ